MRGRRIAMVLTLAAMFTGGSASGALASTVTIGSPLSGAFVPTELEATKTVFNSALPEAGSFVTSPVSGAIIRWRVVGASDGPFKLRVLAPGAANTYLAVGTTGGGLPTSTGIQTFTTVLPIKAGQTIGLDNTAATDKIGIADVPGASFGFISPFLKESATAAGTEVTNKEIGFNADIQPLPVVTEVAPATGSIAGGTTVTITGTDFVTVKSVTFGGFPAASFTVDSASQITAVSPAVPRPGPVDVFITTVAGRSVAADTDQFTYKACVVPKLKGKTLKIARKRLKKNGCRLGQVKGNRAAGNAATVVKQTIAPNKVRLPGTKVGVTVR